LRSFGWLDRRRLIKELNREFRERAMKSYDDTLNKLDDDGNVIEDVFYETPKAGSMEARQRANLIRRQLMQ
jgi:hypothetical protein